tara:strand:- start:558 stop:863 length:306 start_codon:yes stop_codon:yes gene_type:complete
MKTETKPKFKLGQIVATPGALEAFERNNTSGREYLGRHLTGDWGVISDEDGYLNDMAIKDGSRILSSYLLPDETKIWIITDAEIDTDHNRQATTFLLPEEY